MIKNFLFKFAKMVIKISNSKSKIKFLNAKKKLGINYEDIPRRVPDLRKIKNLAGNLTHHLRTALKKLFIIGLKFK